MDSQNKSTYKTLLTVAVVIGLIIALYFLFGHKATSVLPVEKLADINMIPFPADEDVKADINDSLLPQPELDLEALKEVPLLPKYDESEQFAKDHPVTDLLRQQNFIVGGHHNGINSTLQSNKIPYLDIRALPPIVKEDVSPWNKSSYEQIPGGQRRGFVLN